MKLEIMKDSEIHGQKFLCSECWMWINSLYEVVFKDSDGNHYCHYCASEIHEKEINDRLWENLKSDYEER